LKQHLCRPRDSPEFRAALTELERLAAASATAILCAGTSEKHVELLQLDRSGIRVATYLTELPARPLLERKPREMMAAARARLEARSPNRSD
jgi:hypothetical protein